MVIISLVDGSLQAHYLFTFSINNFINRDENFLLFSYRKSYFFQADESLPKAPKILTKEPKFIAVTPFCSYAVKRKGKFSCISQVDKTIHIHFEVSFTEFNILLEIKVYIHTEFLRKKLSNMKWTIRHIHFVAFVNFSKILTKDVRMNFFSDKRVRNFEETRQSFSVLEKLHRLWRTTGCYFSPLM